MKVDITTVGPRANIRLDGHDVSNGVRAYQVIHDSPAHLPRLTLDPLVTESQIGGEMQVYVRPEARELLIRLGWTPPGVSP